MAPRDRPAPRIACFAVPLFPLAARLRSEPELTDEALAVLTGDGDASRVVAATRLARRAGVRPGMTLTQARALLPQLIGRSRDEECERAAQEALFEVAETFSPRVEDAGDGRVYGDLTGGGGLLPDGDRAGSELEMARAMERAAERDAGLPARLGIASSKLAARVAAESTAGATVVPPGQEAEFLAPLPIERLSPQVRVATTLERWGLATVGDLARLPAAEVQSRLGRAGQDLHAVARGLDPSPLIPREPPPTFDEGMDLEWPLVALEPFLFVARAALERLASRLEARGFACTRLVLRLRLEPDGHDERSVSLPAPTLDTKALLTLLRLNLEARPPGAAVAGFTCIAHPHEPRTSQMSLLGPEGIPPDRLGTTLARLFALLGPDRVGSPRRSGDPRPEGFELVPYEPPPPPRVRQAPRRGLGLLTVRVLRPPVGLEVITSARAGTANGSPPPDGDPGSLRLLAVEALPCRSGPSPGRPPIAGRVRVAAGPWHLEEAWWTGEPTDREYWDVELDGGALYRIYRDRSNGEWFADGAYD